ncbi:hypothetical protein MKW92_041694, partial [Papaver armeniacum]
HFVDATLQFDASYIYKDVNHAIQHVHQSGFVHRGILFRSSEILSKICQILRFLKMLKEKGKKLFLMTNSPYYFVDGDAFYVGGEESRKLTFSCTYPNARRVVQHH